MDSNTFIYWENNREIIYVVLINISVNDLLLIKKDQKSINKIKKYLKNKYNVKNISKINIIIE